MNNLFNRPEPNIVKSPYKDLVLIQEGTYHGKIVQKIVANDAEKLFNAIYSGNRSIIEKMLQKYQKEYLTFKKAGTTRDRYIPVNVAKIRIYELALKASHDLFLGTVTTGIF